MKRIVIIAEAGVNHNGDPATALALVDAAATAGADYVKFQTFDPAALATGSAPKAPYQGERDGHGESQRAMLERLVLPRSAHAPLMRRCRERGIGFLSTPFDPGSLAFLADDLGLRLVKIGSGDLTDAPLLLAAARRSLDLILSTGMAGLEEVEQALGVLAFGYLGPSEAPGRGAFARAFTSPRGQALLRRRVRLLHCTSAYPCPWGDVHLRAMDRLRRAFGLPVGYSDHTQGLEIGIAAAARGACILEKHFTLDRTQAGPDHAASLEPGELAALVGAVRHVEEALGDGDKRLRPSERANREVARKGLVAARPIRAGALIGAADIAAKRPQRGRPALDYWQVVGSVAGRDYAPDEPIQDP